MSDGEVVTLNVGGRLFTTTRTTLTSESDSVLGRMFDPTSSLPPARMVDGAFFIDANPKVFEVILDFLRHRCILLPPSLPLEAVLAQARYFGLESLLAGEGELGAEARVRINAGGAIFETTRATLTGQPDSHLAKLLSKGEQELFLDVCPKVKPSIFYTTASFYLTIRLLKCFYASCGVVPVRSHQVPQFVQRVSGMLPSRWA